MDVSLIDSLPDGDPQLIQQTADEPLAGLDEAVLVVPPVMAELVLLGTCAGRTRQLPAARD